MLAIWPHTKGFATPVSPGQTGGTTPEDCSDNPTTNVGNPGLASGGGDPGPNGAATSDPIHLYSASVCEGSSDLTEGGTIRVYADGGGGGCGKQAASPYGNMTESQSELAFHNCDEDGLQMAFLYTPTMLGLSGGHDDSVGYQMFSLWDPYIVTDSNDNYYVVLGPGLEYEYEKSGSDYVPVCSDANYDGVTLDASSNLLTLTMKRGVRTVKYEFHDFNQGSEPVGRLSAYVTDKNRYELIRTGGVDVTQIRRRTIKDGNISSAIEQINIGGYGINHYRGYAYHEYYDGSNWQKTKHIEYDYDSSGYLLSMEFRTDYDGTGDAGLTSNWDKNLGKRLYRYNNDFRIELILDVDAVEAAEAALVPGTVSDIDDPFNLTLTAQLAAHATRQYTYYTTGVNAGKIKTVKGEGCGGCGSGSSEIEYTWVENNTEYTTGTERYNRWWRRQTEEHKDSGGTNVYLRKTTYYNRAGLVMCKIVESKSDTYGSGGNLEHADITFYQYSSSGQLLKVFEPSSVSGYPKSGVEVDLVALDDELTTDDDTLLGSGKIEFHANQGVVRVTEYWGASPSPAAGTGGARGGVEGYVRYQKVQQGETGATSQTLSETLYTKHSYNSVDVYQVAEYKRFFEWTDSTTNDYASTVWEYTWHEDGSSIKTNDIETITRYRFINENQSTPNTNDALTTVIYLTPEGRKTWHKDERGLVTYYTYSTSLTTVTEMTVDVDTSTMTGVPTGFANAGGSDRNTKFEKDKHNRIIRVTGPESSADTNDDGMMNETARPVSWTVYIDAAYGSGNSYGKNEVRSASGYWDGSAYHLVGGISVRTSERGESSTGVHWSESWITERDGTTGELTSTETVDNRSKMSNWNRTKSVNALMTERWSYYEIPGAGDGTSTDNYLKTTIAYHPDASVKYTEAPNGLRSYKIRDKRTISGIGDIWETRRYSVYDDSGWKLAAPVSVMWTDRDGNILRSYMATTSAGLYGAVDSTGGEPDLDDSLTAVSRTKMTHDWRHRTEETWTYFDLGALTETQDGTEGTNYVVSKVLAYDYQSRAYRTEAPSGDISASVTDAIGRTIEVWAGISASGATRENPGAGASGLVMVSRSFYDSNGDGTGDPTVDLIRSEWLRPNIDAALTGANGEFTGVTRFYDVFGQTTFSKPDVGPWSKMTYNDGGMVTQSISYKNSGSDTLASDLLTKAEKVYDGAARTTHVKTFAVDIGTGSTSNYLLQTFGFDTLGRRALTFNAQGAGTLTQWDDGGRVTRVMAFSDNGGDDTDPSDDTIVTQTETAYLKTGNGAGMAYLSTQYMRNHNAAGTGLLTPTNAQFTHDVSWHDPAGRPTHSAYYGNNAGTLIDDVTDDFDPGTGGTQNYAAGPFDPDPVREDSVIITKTEYSNDRALAYLFTSNDGVKTWVDFDDAGNKTFMVENYDDTKLTQGPDDPDNRLADVNRVTQYVYDYKLGTLIEQIAVDPNHDGDPADSQKTQYIYSNKLNDKGTPTGGLQSNRLLRAVIYPVSDDTVTSNALANGTDGDYDRVELTYYSDGTLKARKDQRRVILTNIYHDDGALQYQNATAVNTSGTAVSLNSIGVDGAVQSIGVTYDDLRRPWKLTQYDDVSSGTPTAVNQVVNTYTDLGQLEEQYQEHDGVATITGGSQSLSVQYGYDTTTNLNVFTKNARINKLTAPGGTLSGSTAVKYGYGASGSITDRFDVIQLLEESDGADRVTYDYFGINNLAVITYERTGVNDVKLDLWGGTSGSYQGYDQFYRTAKMLWTDGTTDYVDINYGYDPDGYRAYHEDVVANTNSLDQLDSRNAFGEITAWKRGDLNGTLDNILSPDDQQAWALDQVGNWKTFVSDLDGGANNIVDELHDRTVNEANEITGITPYSSFPDWEEPTYDAAGNMSSLPDPGTPTQDCYTTFDAWNRLTEIRNFNGDRIAQFVYDFLNRRIQKHVFDSSTDTFEHTDHFYYSGWQMIELRRDDDGTQGGTPNSNPLEILVYHPHYLDAPAYRFYDADLDSSWVRHYYLYDGQYNVAAVINDSNAVLERYTVSPYGEWEIRNASFTDIGTSTIEQAIGYTGQRFDAESGLWYFKSRHYHPQLGTFISRDPLGYVDGMSLYTGYFGMQCGTDPMGMERLEVFVSNLKHQYKEYTRNRFHLVDDVWKVNQAWVTGTHFYNRHWGSAASLWGETNKQPNNSGIVAFKQRSKYYDVKHTINNTAVSHSGEHIDFYVKPGTKITEAAKTYMSGGFVSNADPSNEYCIQVIGKKISIDENDNAPWFAERTGNGVNAEGTMWAQLGPFTLGRGSDGSTTGGVSAGVGFAEVGVGLTVTPPDAKVRPLTYGEEDSAIWLFISADGQRYVRVEGLIPKTRDYDEVVTYKNRRTRDEVSTYLRAGNVITSNIGAYDGFNKGRRAARVNREAGGSIGESGDGNMIWEASD
jgi:RHS repeat-associated protein